jgi:dihydrofolate synthase/folylpolyglutamate synthase
VSGTSAQLPAPLSYDGPLSYDAALRAVQERGRFGVRLGLSRTRALLRSLGDPQQGIRGALVAGTNGKGSVLALTAAALREAGYRVGTTPKPHLVSYRERMVVDGHLVDPSTFARLVGEILPFADRVARRHGDPTEFELLTAAVFRWFAEVGVDVAIVEVGLGGRLDATHAWDGGVAVITNVALDHTEWLGPTIPAIAREKAAIIERGDRAVTGATGDGLRVVRRRARRVGASLVEVADVPVLETGRDGIVVELSGLGRTTIGLRGRHQALNVGVADATLDALEAAGIASVDPDARRRGYAATRWPGRLELLEVPGPTGQREVLLDGAHNPAGAAVLATALEDLAPFVAGGRSASPDDGRGAGDVGWRHAARRPRVPLTLVMGVMRDKDVDGILDALGRSDALQGATIICTEVGSPRGLDAPTLAARWSLRAGPASILVEPDLDRALDRALHAPGLVVVAGSLYLVGAVRGRLVDDPELRDDSNVPGKGGSDDARG